MGHHHTSEQAGQLQQDAFAWLDAFVSVADDARSVFKLERRVAAQSLSIALIAASCLGAVLVVLVGTLALAMGTALFQISGSLTVAFLGVAAALALAGWAAATRLARYAGNLRFRATRQALSRAHV